VAVRMIGESDVCHDTSPHVESGYAETVVPERFGAERHSAPIVSSKARARSRRARCTAASNTSPLIFHELL